jgi:hypothetical protein
MSLTREQIMERLQTVHVDVLPSRTALFRRFDPATAVRAYVDDPVPERKIRYVVGIFISGDGVASRTLDIEKLEEGTPTAYTMKFRGIPVAPADHREIPESGYDIENPIVTCEGGTQLYGTASGNTLYVTTIYYDNDV